MNEERKAFLRILLIVAAIIGIVIEGGAIASVYWQYNTMRQTGGFLWQFPLMLVGIVVFVYAMHTGQLPRVMFKPAMWLRTFTFM